MRQLRTFIRKEFIHVFYDRRTLLMLFGLPIAQIILFGFALSLELQNAKIAVVDYAHDATSQAIIQKVSASVYFDLAQNVQSESELEAVFRKGKIKAALVFPANFGSDVNDPGGSKIQIIADATDINTANTISNYLTSIINDYQMEQNQNSQIPMQIIPDIRMLYNPQLKGEYTFIPGMMAMIMMLVGVMMTAIAIVRERELGTMEILLVSPFRPLMVIIAKFIPYLIISLINVTSILLLSKLFLGLGVNGSLVLLYAESLLFIMTSLALGLLISIIADSQQTAMFVSIVGTMLPTLLLSGFVFPIANMPAPLQVISHIVPSRWYYEIVKSIMIKGLGFSFIWKQTLILAGMTIFLILVSIRKFKIRLE